MLKVNRKVFFDGYRSALGSLNQSQVDGLAFLLGRFEADVRWIDLRKVAYSLATIKRECANTWQPIEERGGKIYLSKYYLKPSLRRALGNIKLSDAWVYKGRSYIQLTGRKNYELFGKLLGLPLLERPEIALQPDVGFQIMTSGLHEGLFTGTRLSDYITPKDWDYFQARRTVNGLDHAREIAHDAREFEEILNAATG